MVERKSSSVWALPDLFRTTTPAPQRGPVQYFEAEHVAPSIAAEFLPQLYRAEVRLRDLAKRARERGQEANAADLLQLADKLRSTRHGLSRRLP
jgi:hypothetical protein